jgi:hypothetical protein
MGRKGEKEEEEERGMKGGWGLRETVVNDSVLSQQKTTGRTEKCLIGIGETF